MTLVPIIYTSLIIFASLLTFIILASYIAFKARSGNQVRPTIVEPQYGYISKPIISNYEPIRRDTIRTNTQIKPSYSNDSDSHNFGNKILQPKLKTVFNQEIQRPRRYENTTNQGRSKERNYEENLKSSRILEQNYTRRQADRIEIMNNSEKYRKTSEFDNFPSQVSGSISDSNLLNYYSDRADLDFTVMNANYLRKAL